jgi:hypothetical protein
VLAINLNHEMAVIFNLVEIISQRYIENKGHRPSFSECAGELMKKNLHTL